jgi:hypothetical protein
MGSPPDQTIALASIANGRVERRLTGPRGAVIGSMASSPDGQTIYYTASGSVWAVPVTDGAPQKVRAGDLVTVDPYRRELIVGLIERGGVRLLRQPLAGGPERPIPVQAGVRISDFFLNSAAVGRDGRIALQVIDDWFYPAGILDPQTGRIQILRIGYGADIQAPAWTDDGKIVVIAHPLQASLWRFTPDSGP